MSIAVHAIVLPSRLLQLVLLAFALTSCSVGLVVLMVPDHFYFSSPIVLACMGATAFTARAAGQLSNAWVLDISGLGDMRLSVQHMHGMPEQDALWQLLPGSTLWPWLMVLRLRRPATDHAGSADCLLIILPDCVAPDQFRQLAVSARAIARRDNKFFENNKIF